MADIIQQLLDLKEWSQNPERYERRLNFRGAGLVQPGPEGVREGYAPRRGMALTKGDNEGLKKFLKKYKGKTINKSDVARQFGYKDKAAVDRLLKELGKTELLKSPHPLHGPSRKVIAELQSLPDGSAIKLYELADKLDVDPDAVKTALKKPEIIKKNITLTSYGVDYLDNKKFKELFKDFKGSDRQFAEYLNTQTKYKSATRDPFSSYGIEERRRRLNLKSKNPNPFMAEGISDKQVLSEAKRLDVNTKGVSLKELRRKTAQRRGDEAHRMKMKIDPEYVERQRKYKQATQERIKADPELLEKKKEQQRAWARKNRPYGGIHHTKSPQGYLWRDLMDNATRYQYGRLPESHIKFKNPNQKFPTSAPKTEAVELIDTNVLDKKEKPKVITYDNVLEHIDDNQRRYGMSSKDILNEYEKKIFIQQNPELRDQLNRKMYKAYDPSSPRQRAVFSPGHIHHTAGRGQNAFNVQFAPGTANMRENALRTKFKKDWQVAKTLSDKKTVTRRYLDAVPEDIEVRLKKVPYGTRLTFMEQIKRMGGKDFKMTPEVKAQVNDLVKKLGEAEIPLNREGFNQVVAKAAAGDEVAGNKMNKFLKNMRKAKGPLKWTLYGLLAEIGFMVPFGAMDYAAGKSWKRILGNATDWGLGPMLGQSEQEEFEAALPEGSKAIEAQNIVDIGGQLDRFGTRARGPMVGMDRGRYEGAQTAAYNKLVDEYNLNYQPFVVQDTGDAPVFSESLYDRAHQEAEATRARIAAQEAQRIQEREERGILAQPNFMQQGRQRGYAGGGIANVRRPNAIPPVSGPVPQGGGLSTMFNRVKPW